ncbi:zinc finger protein, putative [Plasmodium knowlesi strain H]|uniref:Zinc finger protein, putative n=2 Tax=Plasmodium knowlesi (strain H) TaxID=5851 RepID=A0A5E7WZB8_PLAKH|nr:zinc finger protein, putative [Plasmodium knowlesi strain H]CAA9987906.1 zinc finger protein, putative [Plasmodium knowlesi strain H]SBO22249.1 zinc finger protein, putative [Plasmodium knowlesi strain H]SBO28839.1 zinc finger protein, putative [Plasmodium knowlesi strain H]VVS77380.1 zinc finger protein, putative [Plasmodium knowlesi strain H]
MSSFANNGGNYRNRTLGTSPKCQNINHKVTSVENGPSVFCTLCALPYNAKIRLNPCFHVICSKCYELCAQQQACLLCNVEINDVEFLFIGENIFVCPYGDCKKGFLNLKCFHYHIHFKHQFMKLGNYYTEDRSSSSISDRQNARGDTLSFPINEPFSTSFFSNNDGLNAYTASNEDDQEFNYESAKNEPSGSATNITISRAPGMNVSRGDTLPPVRDTPFNVHSNPINNFTVQSKNLSLQSSMPLGGGAINTNEKNASGENFSTPMMQFTGKWDYGNVPFKSDFNTFNMPPNSDALAPSKNNSLGPSGKENEEDDYDNLEDLM